MRGGCRCGSVDRRHARRRRRGGVREHALRDGGHVHASRAAAARRPARHAAAAAVRSSPRSLALRVRRRQPQRLLVRCRRRRVDARREVGGALALHGHLHPAAGHVGADAGELARQLRVNGRGGGELALQVHYDTVLVAHHVRMQGKRLVMPRVQCNELVPHLKREGLQLHLLML
jgi:hypothetical protein